MSRTLSIYNNGFEQYLTRKANKFRFTMLRNLHFVWRSLSKLCHSEQKYKVVGYRKVVK